MDSEFKVLLYHSEVRWLSLGKVINRVFVLRAELLEFLIDHNHRHAKHFNNPSFLLTLAYLADIFAALNHLNCQMQGGGVSVIEAEEKLCAFQRKLELWRQRLENDNFANFLLLDKIASSSSTAMNDKEDHNDLQRLKSEFVEHLQKSQLSFKNYFPDQRKYPEWIRQPFAFDTTTVNTNNQHLDDIIELQESKVQKLFFNSTNLETFWCQQMESYPRIAKVDLDVLTSFVTTYLCKRAFSTSGGSQNKEAKQACM